jgi:peptidoglycan hydrolase-like protein with peptidoglycan-binding domain
VPGKPIRRRTATKRPAAEAAADSAIARVVDRAFDNPAMSGGLMVMAITAMAIMSNALFLQAGRHPEPLFATRPAAVAQAPARSAATVPLPHPREQLPAAIAAPAPKVAVAPPAAVPAQADPNKVLITAVQRELARLGVYTDAIDGRFGPRTKAAIATWQAAAGMTATGEPTADLLAAMRRPVAAVPTPAAAVVPAAVKEAANSDQVAAAVARAEELEREQAAIALGAKLRGVQVALNQIGYGPLTVDGQPNQQTGDAIRRFQLDNGQPVTGELNDKVIERLVGIGAMKAE